PTAEIIEVSEKIRNIIPFPKIISFAAVFAIVVIGSVYFSRFSKNDLATNESAVFDVASSTAIAEATAEEGYDSYSAQKDNGNEPKEDVNAAAALDTKGADNSVEDALEAVTEENSIFVPCELISNGYAELYEKLSEISQLYRYNGYIEVSQALYSKTKEVKSADGNTSYKAVYENGNTTIFVYDIKNSTSQNLLATIKCDGMFSNIFTIENRTYIMCELSVYDLISNNNGEFSLDIIPCFYVEDSKISSKTMLTNKQITIMQNAVTPIFTTILGITPTEQSIDMTAFAIFGKVDNFTVDENILTLTNNGAEVVLSLGSDKISLISNK
ncbi:MAG: beta-propeller domain-containing protein, partial [Oscillospiraceae bacterium]|nr:beta-propeller domain-containing protein [Oscillospiraceae bacterium]